MKLSEAEWAVVKAMVEDLTKLHREDVAGVVLRLTGHKHLDAAGVVALAAKLEGRDMGIDDRAAAVNPLEAIARQHARNEEYYRGLLARTADYLAATRFGAELRTCDDGSQSHEVLVSKIPEVAAKLALEVAGLEQHQRAQDKVITYLAGRIAQPREQFVVSKTDVDFVRFYCWSPMNPTGWLWSNDVDDAVVYDSEREAHEAIRAFPANVCEDKSKLRVVKRWP